MTNQITWTAGNNSTFLNGSRKASSVLAAVRAGREYLRNELMGEGKIQIFDGEDCVRQDEKSLQTGFRWNVRTF